MTARTDGRPNRLRTVYPTRINPELTVRRRTYVTGPDSGLTTLQVWEMSSRETFRTADGRNVALWIYSRIDDRSTPWDVVYMPTGQRRQFGNSHAARMATADGSLLAELAKEDAEVMAQFCPGGCGRPAAAIVNTVNGAAPVCAVHRPVIEGRGFVTRAPANIDV